MRQGPFTAQEKVRFLKWHKEWCKRKRARLAAIRYVVARWAYVKQDGTIYYGISRDDLPRNLPGSGWISADGSPLEPCTPYAFPENTKIYRKETYEAYESNMDK